MMCEKCGQEMEGGYSFRLALAGTIKIEKMEIKEDSMQPMVYICPKCGGVELCIEPANLNKEKKWEL